MWCTYSMCRLLAANPPTHMVVAQLALHESSYNVLEKSTREKTERDEVAPISSTSLVRDEGRILSQLIESNKEGLSASHSL